MGEEEGLDMGEKRFDVTVYQPGHLSATYRDRDREFVKTVEKEAKSKGWVVTATERQSGSRGNGRYR